MKWIAVVCMGLILPLGCVSFAQTSGATPFSLLLRAAQPRFKPGEPVLVTLFNPLGTQVRAA
jgi:hypothetical protein